MKILVARHGQTDWNLEQRTQGTIDIPLNNTGIAQALMVKQILLNEQIDLIISSPLIRALKTASIICGNRAIPIITDTRIAEINIGSFEGKSKHCPNFKKFLNYNADFTFDNAESIKHLVHRVSEFLTELPNKYSNKSTILLATHGIVTAGISVYFNGIPEDGCLYTLIAENCEVRKYFLNAK